MSINKEFSDYISSMEHELVQIIIGPRQCDKSSLLWHISPDFEEVTFDDLQLRSQIQNDNVRTTMVKTGSSFIGEPEIERKLILLIKQVTVPCLILIIKMQSPL